MRRLVLFLIGLGLAAPALAQPRVPQDRAEIALSFAPVVRRAAPAVVSINTRVRVQAAPNPFMNDPFFRRFFGDGFPGMGEQFQNSLGSGVIVDASGLIVTNNHVIRGAEQIQVILADRREFDATVLRADERTDLAVLRIDAAGQTLPALALRDSDDLEVGDLVLAIGNPFGIGQTVTQGIVSALARTQVGVADFRSFIQTDAAINPGNSGGALIALDGRLVGINTAIFSQSGGSLGIGFAIPSNMVQAILVNARAGGRFVRPWFGAGGQAVTPDIAQSVGLPRPAGIALTEIVPEGPAARAGLRRGDVVLQVAGREVNDPQAMRFRLATQPLDRPVRVTVWREGRERELSVTQVAPPEIPPRDPTMLRGNHPFTGATFANLNPALADEIAFDGPIRGVIVTDIRRGSPAAAIQLQPGDMPVRINDIDILSMDDLRRASQSPAPWRLAIRRGDRVLNAVVGR